MNTTDFGQLIKAHPEILDSPKTFAAFLRDIYPTEKGNVNLMITTYNAGVVSMLRSSALDSLLTSRIMTLLMDDYSISKERARWAAELWISAYAFSIGRTAQVEPQRMAATQGRTSVRPTASAPVQKTSPSGSNRDRKPVADFFTKIVGVTHNNTGTNTENRQIIIQELKSRGQLEPGQALTLELDTENRWSENAVKVIAPDGRQLGYLSQTVADKNAPQMRDGYEYQAFVSAVTGGENGFVYGVNIRITAYSSASPSPIQKAEKEINSAIHTARNSDITQITTKNKISPILLPPTTLNPQEIVQKKLSTIHLHKIETCTGFEKHQVFPRYQRFVKKFQFADGYIGTDSHRLYFFSIESKSVQQITKNEEYLVDFDIRENSIYTILTFYDTDSKQEKYCIKKFVFQKDLSVSQQTLLSKDLISLSPKVDSLGGTLRIRGNGLLIQLYTYSEMESLSNYLLDFDLETESMKTSHIFNDFVIKEFDVLNNQIWAIALCTDKSQKDEMVLLCLDHNDNLSKVSTLNNSCYDLCLESPGFISPHTNYNILINLCCLDDRKIVFQQCAVKDLKDEYKYVYNTCLEEKAYLLNGFFVSFIQYGPGGTPEDPVPDVDTQIFMSHFTDPDLCLVSSLRGEQVDNYCVVDQYLFLSCSNNYNFEVNLYMVDLSLGNNPIAILENEEYLRSNGDVTSVSTNPEHENARQKLSQYSLYIDNYGSCQIINCARRVSDIITVLFLNGQTRTFSTSILGKTAKVENDPNGKLTAELISLVNETLEYPEYLNT